VWGDDAERRYKVVVNAEEQYSIWPEGRQNAPGWTDEGKNGTRAECLAHIQAVWTDLRPASLRLGLLARADEKTVP
jgi:MbtH protein